MLHFSLRLLVCCVLLRCRNDLFAFRAWLAQMYSNNVSLIVIIKRVKIYVAAVSANGKIRFHSIFVCIVVNRVDSCLRIGDNYGFDV